MVGRTLPTWDTFGKKNGFSPQAPWLLQNFDTIRFKQVSQAEYDLQLRAFKAGTYTWEVRDTSFDVAQQSEFLTSVQEEVEAFRKKQAVTLEQCRVEEEKLFAEWREEQDKALESKATSGGDWENRELLIAPVRIIPSGHPSLTRPHLFRPYRGQGHCRGGLECMESAGGTRRQSRSGTKSSHSGGTCMNEFPSAPSSTSRITWLGRFAKS